MTIENINVPIKVFDLETTGLDKTKDSVIQFAGITVDPKTCKIIDSLNLFIQPKGEYNITLGAYYKHGIHPNFLKDKPYFEDVAQQILDFFEGDNVILTYNGLSFDLSFLQIEFAKIGIDFSLINKPCYDAFLREKALNDLTLEGRFKHYFGTTMEEKGLKAHDALSDVKATFMIFAKQQTENSYGPEEVITECNTIKYMMFNNENVPCFSLGKYRGVSVEMAYSLDKDYFNWIISDRCSFSPSCKSYISNFIKEKSKS